MAEDTQKNLRFSVEESVWLRKGQEVDEILSMSLEPDISIDENKHYVSVRGALKLTGEYRPDENPQTEEEGTVDDTLPLQDQVSYRSIDEISLSESGLGQIEHRFPIDITIPYSRIEHLDDIYVTVDSFDYVVPEQNCIRVSADVSISGMVEEVQKEEPETDEAQEQVSLERSEGEEFEEENTGQNEEPDEQEEEVYEPFHYEAIRESGELAEEEDRNEVVEDKQRGPLIEMKTRGTESDQLADVESQFVTRRQEELAQEFEANEDSTHSDESGETEEKQPVREENALYLTKMLTREEEEFSKLKMCIIQRGESLNTIAARYEMSPGHLVRVNGLSDEEVEEGQILYIPVSSS